MSFIAQLETGGGLAHWAVYAALHIPGADERDRVRAVLRGGGRTHARNAALHLCLLCCVFASQSRGRRPVSWLGLTEVTTAPW